MIDQKSCDGRPHRVMLIILGFWLTNLTLAFGSDNQKVKNSIRKATVLIQKSTDEYLKHRECFSCHHQSMPVIALDHLRLAGFEIDVPKFEAQVEHTYKHFKKNKQRYVETKGTGGQVDTAGYGLWALEAGGIEKSEFTDAVIDYLLKRDKGKPFWRRSSERPPSENSNFTATYVAVRAIQFYGNKDSQKSAESKGEASRLPDKKVIQDKFSRVRKWILETKAKETEDTVFKLRLMDRLKFEKNQRTKIADALIESQNSDGGWSQKKGMDSDAYATASVMVALIDTNMISPTDARYQKGVSYLLANQKEDGSWFVKSRSSPFQEYFESGFPHKKDQFISITASCWAVMALANSIGKK